MRRSVPALHLPPTECFVYLINRTVSTLTGYRQLAKELAYILNTSVWGSCMVVRSYYVNGQNVIHCYTFSCIK